MNFENELLYGRNCSPYLEIQALPKKHRNREVIPRVNRTIAFALVKVQLQLQLASSFDLDVQFSVTRTHAYSMDYLLVMEVAAEWNLDFAFKDTTNLVA